jgi:hypothetical protein
MHHHDTRKKPDDDWPSLLDYLSDGSFSPPSLCKSTEAVNVEKIEASPIAVAHY